MKLTHIELEDERPPLRHHVPCQFRVSVLSVLRGNQLERTSHAGFPMILWRRSTLKLHSLCKLSTSATSSPDTHYIQIYTRVARNARIQAANAILPRHFLQFSGSPGDYRGKSLAGIKFEPGNGCTSSGDCGVRLRSASSSWLMINQVPCKHSKYSVCVCACVAQQ